MSWSVSINRYRYTLGHVPDARTETAAEQNCLHVLLVGVAGRHRAWGELSRKVRLIAQSAAFQITDWLNTNSG
jgi:hypothetical protein